MKVIIIDDEPDCVKLLSLQLKMYCPEAEVVAECTESEEGLRQIQLLSPDVVMLDIEMPVMNGFQLLDALDAINFSLIFVTAYDKFAVRAFRYAAIDYLLKPIDAKELIEAVKKVTRIQKITEQQLLQLKQQYNKPHIDKIALPFQNGVSFVLLKDILYCESDNNYTRFFMLDGQKYLITKTLREVQELLEEQHFLRVHRQYIINLDQIKKFIRGEGCYVILSNELNIPVSRSQKDKLIERFGWV